MSVINTMLKDLERRGAAETDSGHNILKGLSANRDNNELTNAGNDKYLIGVVSVIMALALIAVLYTVSPYRLTTTTQAAVSETKAAAGHVARAIPVTDAAPDSAIAAAEVVEIKPQPAPAPVAKIETPEPAAQQPGNEKAPVATLKSAVTETAAPVRRKAAVVAASDVSDEDDDSADDRAQVNKQQREFTAEEKSTRAYVSAHALYDKNNKQEAKALLNQAIEHNSQNAEAHKLLVMIYLQDGRADIAAEVVAKGLAALPADQGLLRLYVRSLVQTKNYQQAIAVMEKRLKLTTPDDLGYLAGLYQKNNDHVNAVKLYAQALQLIPSRSVWWMGQGISLEVMQQYNEALVSYQQSIKTGQLSGKLADYAITRINVIKQHNPDAVS